MAPPKVALLSCGSFNPLTNMHLRMFELARDHFNKTGQYNVVCGIVSPVHDAYTGKRKNLLSATHRCAMIQHALESNDWVRLSNWECQQETWNRTKLIIQYHQNQINAVVNGHITISPKKRAKRVKDDSWIPENLKNVADGNVQVKLICGADLLESMGTPGLWADEDIADIVGEHGIVVITRRGADPYKFIYESDILTKFQNNITIVTEWIPNDVSSTKIRRSLQRGESVKYLIPDSVIDYIKRHCLYSVTDNKYLYPPTTNQNCFLTPSPTDINMDSPSPTSQFDFTQNSINLEKSFGSPLIGSKVTSTYISINDVDGNVTAREEVTKKSTYPGQAVQIVRNADGVNEIYNHKVSSDEIESTVANVQIQITKDGITVISDKETTV